MRQVLDTEARVDPPPLTALLTAIRKLASPPKRLAIVLETGTYAMGITSIGTPFFHCWPRALESFLGGEFRIRTQSGHIDADHRPLLYFIVRYAFYIFSAGSDLEKNSTVNVLQQFTWERCHKNVETVTLWRVQCCCAAFTQRGTTESTSLPHTKNVLSFLLFKVLINALINAANWWFWKAKNTPHKHKIHDLLFHLFFSPFEGWQKCCCTFSTNYASFLEVN